MAVVIIIGILAAIMAPSWLMFYLNWEIRTSRDLLHQGLQKAQNNAMTTRTTWRFSLRESAAGWEWAVHPQSQPLDLVAEWTPLSDRVDLYLPDTTLPRAQGVYYARFNHRGTTNSLGTVTVMGREDLGRRQCVLVSTLLGATRRGTQHPTPNGNRYCY